MSKQNANEEKQKRSELLKDSAVTILTNGCHFKGKLFCRGSTRIGGRVEGEIVSEGLLIIESDAVIKADIEADEVIIQGEVDGRLEAKVRIELCSLSRFKGSIVTPVLSVKEGAQFNGTSTMNAGGVVNLNGVRSHDNKRAGSAVLDEVRDDVSIGLDNVARVSDVLVIG